jgi:SsrA-binding protein
MIVSRNKKAFYDAEIAKKYMAGIKLRGYEVKAVKEGKVNFDGSYVQFIGNDLFVVNMYIGKYTHQSQDISDNEQRRSRKLLLKSEELEAIRRYMQEKGRISMPLNLLLEHNLVKLELGVGKLRKKLEKKQVEKEKQIKKDLESQSKEYRQTVGM